MSLQCDLWDVSVTSANEYRTRRPLIRSKVPVRGSVTRKVYYLRYVTSENEITSGMDKTHVKCMSWKINIFGCEIVVVYKRPPFCSNQRVRTAAAAVGGAVAPFLRFLFSAVLLCESLRRFFSVSSPETTEYATYIPIEELGSSTNESSWFRGARARHIESFAGSSTLFLFPCCANRGCVFSGNREKVSLAERVPIRWNPTKPRLDDDIQMETLVPCV